MQRFIGSSSYTYLHFFKEEITETTDNPPVGILLVAKKDHAQVKNATAGMDENLFVQQYMIQLPKLEKLKAYLENELKKLVSISKVKTATMTLVFETLVEN